MSQAGPAQYIFFLNRLVKEAYNPRMRRGRKNPAVILRESIRESSFAARSHPERQIVARHTKEASHA